MKYSPVLVMYPTSTISFHPIWKGMTYSSLMSQQQHRSTTIT